MGTLSIFQSCFLFIIVSYLTASVSTRIVPLSVLNEAEDRFEVTIKELHQMCKIKGINMFENVLHFHVPYINISKIATKKVFETISTAKNIVDLESFTEEHCIQNPEMKMYLQLYTDLVQICMDDNHRLGEEKKKIVFEMFLKRVCSDVGYDALENFDSECFKAKRTLDAFSDCYGSDEPLGVVFNNDYMLPIRNQPTKNECTGIFKFYECVIFSVQQCEETTKRIVEKHFNEKKSFSGCKI